MLAIKRVTAIGPKDFARKIKGGETAIPKTGIHPFPVRNRGWRRVTIALLFFAGQLAKDLLVEQDFTRFCIEAKDPARLSLVCCRSEKKLFAPDNRGGPGFPRDFLLPMEVFLFTPIQRQLRLGGKSLPTRSPKFGPIF